MGRIFQKCLLVAALCGIVQMACAQRQMAKVRQPPPPEWLRSQTTSLIGELAPGKPSSWLVKGEVVEGPPLPKEMADVTSIRLQVRITHVYSGPEALQGKIFKLIFFLHPNGYYNPNLEPAASRNFPKGRQLITALNWSRPADALAIDGRDGEAELLNDRYGQAYNFNSPQALDGSATAKIVEGHAIRVEEVYRANTEQQKSLLLRYAQQQIPLTSEWALRSVFAWDTEESRVFLKQLSQNLQLTVSRMLSLDSYFATSQRATWVGSQERATFLMRIVNTPQTSEEMVQVFSYFYLLMQTPSQLEITTSSKLISSLASNPLLPLINKQSLAQMVTYALNVGNLDKNSAFDLWIALLTTPQNRVKTAYISQELVRNGPWSPTQTGIVSTAVEKLKTVLVRANKNEATQIAKAIQLLTPLLSPKLNG